LPVPADDPAHLIVAVDDQFNVSPGLPTHVARSKVAPIRNFSYGTAYKPPLCKCRFRRFIGHSLK
jgi:hypothetical protein